MFFNRRIILKAAQSFVKFYSGRIDSAVIMGSGLTEMPEGAEILKEIPFRSVKDLPLSDVKGHHNLFKIARLENKTVLISQGRVHLYEGYTAFEVALAVAMMGEIGIREIILTNAAGGISAAFRTGDIMLITDHLNLQDQDPLTGMKDASRFLSMHSAYDHSAAKILKADFKIKTGVYAGLPGPSYETPAEIRFLKTAGADAVGMSTVQEAIMANYYKMKVTGLSVITNTAGGQALTRKPLSHDEVLSAGNKANKKLMGVIAAILKL